MTSPEPPLDEAEITLARLARIPAAFARRGVEFIAIGGWAVQAQQLDLGYLSKDVDFTPAPDPENLRRLSDALEDLKARVRAGDESFPFAHDAESLARISTLNLTCDYGNFDLCGQPAGIAGGYDELAQRAHTVLISVDGDTIPVRCADLADIVRSKQAADRPKDREVMELLVAQLHDRDANRQPRRGDDRGLSP